MKIDTLTIVGVGLIGGSVALAARKRGLVKTVLGVGRSEQTLNRACACGAIDEGFTDPTRAAARTDLAVVCTPVDRIAADALALAANCRPGTLLTDAGSTKATIVRALDGRLPRGVTFVGSHPLAGSEKSGVEHAVADLFQDRLTIVTPSPSADDDSVGRTCAFWAALGSRVRMMNPVEHDRALALTSHLPHLLASALAGILPRELFELTATGFRDTTRVAAGDPALWTAIFRQNRSAVLESLDDLSLRLARFREALVADDARRLDDLLGDGKRVRDALGRPKT